MENFDVANDRLLQPTRAKLVASIATRKPMQFPFNPIGATVLWIDIAASLVILGAIEGIIKPIVSHQFNRMFLKHLPALLDSLDAVMPELIRDKSRAELEVIVRDEFDRLSGGGRKLSDRESDRLLKLFEQKYSPLVNADKLHR